jgi:putative transposase
VIISTVYLLVRCLTVLARHEASKDAELMVLRHENAVLRRQADRVRCEPGDRLRLAALPRLAPRRRQGEVFAVTPATLLAWHRRLAARKRDHASRRRPGRPSAAAAIRKLVIRIATDNPMRGHRRVHGELVRPGLTGRSQLKGLLMQGDPQSSGPPPSSRGRGYCAYPRVPGCLQARRSGGNRRS